MLTLCAEDGFKEIEMSAHLESHLRIQFSVYALLLGKLGIFKHNASSSTGILRLQF